MDEHIKFVESDERLRRVPKKLPVLAMRDTVIHPTTIQPLSVGRPVSRAALEAAMAQERHLLLLTQRDAAISEPGSDDLYQVGTVAECLQLLRLPDDTIRVTVEGIARVEVRKLTRQDTYFEVIGEVIPEVEESGLEVTAIRSVLAMFNAASIWAIAFPRKHWKMSASSRNRDDWRTWSSSYINLSIEQRQAILETYSTQARRQLLARYLNT